ncbi:DUF551 domain-containing protein [Salmonella enterica subsp. enterica serovar Mbandaka]|uniref:DUF551 domain-containing protein n=3 Tax=Salmonella enterica TaxID=28901 RepID=A0A5V4VT34_SALER|nr:DUF551 domain-containing protein [Salmonella enterica]EAA9556406.1 DUF551 domain-containing protein [Salmonella enterica subsp. enterica serovar Montevideo]ECA5068333.1 DUF551 domain-containing protein [Salmonella enterica subsp. enterica serovar Oranienburg]EDB6942187.1 DUF551 domain-containing protein [Salmonella enterica subsp. enterica serovar Tennessee]EDR7907113.1 DUF551 domain-containing protein [Salmonella enterica subsp. enterica serovar Thompson]EGP1992532.1 DUF551 domain-containi
MTTITREQQKQILIDTANHVISRDNTSPYSENLRELARIALASLEAEPIGAFHIVDQQVGGTSDYIKDGEWPIDNGVIEVYAAPPGPVVPDLKPDWMINEFHAGWNASRAAMLQGSQPVTTSKKLPFEQWLSQQTGTIDVECGCVMTEVFFHWLRVAYEAGNSPATPDCWIKCSERMPDNDESKPIAIFTGKCLGQGMFVATYDDDGFFDYWEGMEIIGVTHWMPMPAAPQQEAE